MVMFASSFLLSLLPGNDKILLFVTTFPFSKCTELVLLHRSSQALTKLSGLPDLLLGHADGRGNEGAVGHLGIEAHLDSFIEC
jgi:hypothetical protein